MSFCGFVRKSGFGRKIDNKMEAGYNKNILDIFSCFVRLDDRIDEQDRAKIDRKNMERKGMKRTMAKRLVMGILAHVDAGKKIGRAHV